MVLNEKEKIKREKRAENFLILYRQVDKYVCIHNVNF